MIHPSSNGWHTGQVIDPHTLIILLLAPYQNHKFQLLAPFQNHENTDPIFQFCLWKFMQISAALFPILFQHYYIYIHINLRQKTPNSLSLSSISLRILENKYQICELRMARGGSSSSNASRLRKRVDAEDASSTSTALKRARDGSAFARWCSFLAIPFVRLRLDLLFELLFWYQVGLINCSEGCNKDVAVALISFHDCGLDAKIKMNLGT